MVSGAGPLTLELATPAEIPRPLQQSVHQSVRWQSSHIKNVLPSLGPGLGAISLEAAQKTPSQTKMGQSALILPHSAHQPLAAKIAGISFGPLAQTRLSRDRRPYQQLCDRRSNALGVAAACNDVKRKSWGRGLLEQLPKRQTSSLLQCR